MYLDSAYIAKYYLNEPDSRAVRVTIGKAARLVSSAWSIGEVSCAFHRQFRQGLLDVAHVRELSRAFLDHVDEGIWSLVPVTERLLRRVATAAAAAPHGLYLRSGDAIHLITAQDLGESEIWTSDRHMLQAAPHFGLSGRSANP